MSRTTSTASDALLEYVLPRLRGALRENRVTVARAARACGMSTSAMSRRLNGHKAIGVVELGVLSDLVGRSILTFIPPDDNWDGTQFVR